MNIFVKYFIFLLYLIDIIKIYGIETTPFVKRGKKLRIAIHVTGQLARLELKSKIENVISPNLKLGHTVHIYFALDNDVKNVKQTQHYSKYIATPFYNYDKTSIRQYIKEHCDVCGEYPARFRVYLTMRPQLNSYIAINGPSKMDKMWTGTYETDKNRVTPERRFDVNMRMFAFIRDSIRSMQEVELEKQKFYDLIVRIRDDSYFYGVWTFDRSYLNYFSSLKINSWFGVNDHDFALDRKYADRYLRGLIEDYFIDFRKVGKIMKHSTEIYMYRVLQLYKIKIRRLQVCELPSVPFRGVLNETHWKIHSKYAINILNEAKTYNDTMCFREEWKYLLHQKGVNHQMTIPTTNTTTTTTTTIR